MTFLSRPFRGSIEVREEECAVQELSKTEVEAMRKGLNFQVRKTNLWTEESYVDKQDGRFHSKAQTALSLMETEVWVFPKGSDERQDVLDRFVERYGLEIVQEAARQRSDQRRGAHTRKQAQKRQMLDALTAATDANQRRMESSGIVPSRPPDRSQDSASSSRAHVRDSQWPQDSEWRWQGYDS